MTHKLSPRERQVLSMRARGVPHNEIALNLGISPNTVDGYMLTARLKLDAVSTTHAVYLAMRAGLIDQEDGA